MLDSVVWHWCLGERKGIRPVENSFH